MGEDIQKKQNKKKLQISHQNKQQLFVMQLIVIDKLKQTNPFLPQQKSELNVRKKQKTHQKHI